MIIPIRLLLIALLAPAITHLISIIAYSEAFLFTAILSYPIMVVVTLLLLFLLHRLFARKQLLPLVQLPIVVGFGLLGGYLVLLFFMFPQNVMPDFQSRLTIEYASLGVLAAACCWAMYNWGPLRVAPNARDPH